MLAVAVGPEEAQFFSIDEDGATATKLAAFPLRASQALAPLACARIAALEGGAAALAYQSGAAVRIAVVDPWSGELVGDL